jgi:hypothetical protein
VNFRRSLSISNDDFSIFLQGGAARVLVAGLCVLFPLHFAAWAFGLTKARRK